MFVSQRVLEIISTDVKSEIRSTWDAAMTGISRPPKDGDCQVACHGLISECLKAETKFTFHH